MTALMTLLKRPCSLPCGHTFCSLGRGWIIKKDEVTCPTCRDIHDVPQVWTLPCQLVLRLLQGAERTRDTFLLAIQPDKDTETEESSSPAVKAPTTQTQRRSHPHQ
ncbi:hypothetical protein GWK47_049118 [Chionoecetes opilio]|uniref:Zinc finger C3HC4 RING-type domain-containing protein n=1 Tax=Chionoecetes opilio TaxID=41210 RepID=A0A8J4Y4L5_CHIOP|nr:hypothetical protein GWK47_049118 [Chionoecetes opilio]